MCMTSRWLHLVHKNLAWLHPGQNAQDVFVFHKHRRTLLAAAALPIAGNVRFESEVFTVVFTVRVRTLNREEYSWESH